MIDFFKTSGKIAGMEKNLKDIGQRIKKIRVKLGDNQIEFGKRLGVKGPTISNYENGETDAGAIMLAKISKIGKRSLDWLITGEDTVLAINDYERIYKKTVDLTLMKQTIEAVMEHLQSNQLFMPPAKIAELVTVLYEEIIESGANQINKGTVARLIKIANM